jgi:hypothetical protein
MCYNDLMTNYQKQSLERKVADWRKTPATERRAAWRAVLADRVKNSMAMEKEPVSKKWLEKARAGKV